MPNTMDAIANALRIMWSECFSERGDDRNSPDSRENTIMA